MNNDIPAVTAQGLDAELLLNADLLFLDEVMARVGVDGITAAYANAGLLAAVDQHAAAVRESLRDAGRAIDAPALAAYGRSIAAAARRAGRFLPDPGGAHVAPLDWLTAEWHLLRLVAVCMLAEDAAVL
ncbi:MULTISPECIES: DUF6401 family natural product biosynthesis protein [Catenuloplanes]|uniref:Dihydroxyacetone kinase n=2 Tax=Catenuloplanes TaxID=33874 RepID=A0AAE3W7H9_9ACTN|nr:MULTISPECIES: DUF6401 family natural product biosynthesis protein [Catenuloplanes]MDP9795330.1 dihydroxyacetone kinase [Catenuloplanes nepalensis]MDQ0370760.1 dihydroxyacetone kinase [Catenuloplanes indicus]